MFHDVTTGYKRCADMMRKCARVMVVQQIAQPLFRAPRTAIPPTQRMGYWDVMKWPLRVAGVSFVIGMLSGNHKPPGPMQW